MKLPELRQQTDIPALHGQRVRAVGTVERPEMALGPDNVWRGTGLRLDDGGLLWVDYAPEPPAGWVEGQKVVVEAFVWKGAPPDQAGAATGPHLSRWSKPVARSE